MKRFSQDFLARVSRGRPGRAALVLVAAHLGVVVLAAGAWAIGLAPVFDHARWVPIVLVSVVAAVTVLPMYLLFGFTGTLANHGVGSGEDYGEAFGPAAGMALLLLRWVMQLVMVAGVLAALAFTVVDALVEPRRDGRDPRAAGTRRGDAGPGRLDARGQRAR